MWCSNMTRLKTIFNLSFPHFCPLPHTKEVSATVYWKLLVKCTGEETNNFHFNN